MTFQKRYIPIAILLLIGFIWFCTSKVILPGLGRFLIKNELSMHSDAVVVLYTGVDYYPRLMEASMLYAEGRAARVVIDGNRKNDALRKLEAMGFSPCCPWYENTVRLLEIMGVPKEKVMSVSAEDAFDTISEAQAVGLHLLQNRFKRIIVTTSKFHSRRAYHIWKHLYGDDMQIFIAAARNDEFDPNRWWHDGEQIRWVLSEYGAWVYYFWQTAFGRR